MASLKEANDADLSPEEEQLLQNPERRLSDQAKRDAAQFIESLPPPSRRRIWGSEDSESDDVGGTRHATTNHINE